MQYVYDQILQHYETKNNYFSNERFKTTLKAFTFNYLDIDDKRYIHDKNMLMLYKSMFISVILKACVRYFLSNFYFSLNDSPSKTMKNVFYFILKALFVLKIF